MSLAGLLQQAMAAATLSGERQDRVLAGGLCVRVYADPPRALLWRESTVPSQSEAHVVARDLGWTAGRYELSTHAWSGAWAQRPAGLVVRQLREPQAGRSPASRQLGDLDPRLGWTPSEAEVCGTCGRWTPELDGSALGACALGWEAHDAPAGLMFVSLTEKRAKPYGITHPGVPVPLTSRDCRCHALHGGRAGWIASAPPNLSLPTPKGRTP